MSAETILVVDDESVIRELMLEILQGEGYAVETAPDGPAALRRIRSGNDVALLFTDIMMPEMDGITLVREARRIRPQLIPIVMTGFATLETARAAVREGAYDYVLKPFSLGEVKMAVSNAIQRHRLTDENARLREINELFDISGRIASIRDEQELLDFILHAALSRVNARRGSIMVTTEDGQALELKALKGLPREKLGQGVKFGAGVAGWVAKHATPLLVENINAVPDLKPMTLGLDDMSFVSVPLERNIGSGRFGGARTGQPNVLAVLNVTGKKDGGSFTERDLKILSIMANHAAAAVDNVRLIRDIEHAHLSTLQSMALLLEAKDPYTHGHSQRVRDYSVLAARKMGMGQRDIETVKLGAMLHDIGKIGVKDGVLRKTNGLTEDEWRMIKQHPVIGYEVLAPVGFLTKEHLGLVRSHHERIDGSGYPDGLQGDDLSPLVRVIGVADAFDAMSSSRAYRQSLSPAEVARELQEGAGAQFDPDVARLFVDMMASGELDRRS